jgi:regulatory protein
LNNLISKIEVQKKNKDRVNVYIDGEYAFPCNSEIIFRHNIKIGQIVDADNLQEIVDMDNYIKCKNAALRIIEKTYKTQKQIYDKLIMKEYDKKTIEKVLDFLKEYNLLDDEKYAEAYIKDKIKDQGKNKIKYTLIGRGISEDIIVEKLGLIDIDKEEQVATSLAEKKYIILVKSENDSKKIYKKLGDYLIRKGYKFQLIKTVLNKILKDTSYDE